MERNDQVNHPAHYTAGGIECIDAIAAALTSQKDPMQAWLTGQIIKYLWRWPAKNGVEDLEKARFYLNRLIDSLKGADGWGRDGQNESTCLDFSQRATSGLFRELHVPVR